MHHPAELKLHQFMTDAANGKTTFDDEVAKEIGAEVTDAVLRQFGSGKSRDKFTLRMSNIGRPTCQLWFAKNMPEKALPKPTTFVMNMMIGDIVEAVFKGLLRGAGVDYKDTDKVSLSVEDDNDTRISGSYDLVIDGAVDDVKSASPWSYVNKFDTFDTLAKGDSFGYVGQLAGYAKASGYKAGGWWVVNKGTGEFKYVPADNLDMDEELDKIKTTVETVNDNEFKRCFSPVPEFFRGKPTGNTVLNDGCRFCDYRHTCWPTMVEEPARMSKAKAPKTVAYIEE
jgi:hypothetical protein